MVFLKKQKYYEDRPLSKIFEELVDEYVDRHRETLELIGIPSLPLPKCFFLIKFIREWGTGTNRMIAN